METHAESVEQLHDAGGARAEAVPPDAHILVVEDDAGARNLICRLLRAEGYRVTGVADGIEMRQALDHTAADLIVLDIMLPGRSGLELTRELRSGSAVPIIVISARGEEADRVRGLDEGADDYLAKPFSRAELLARIRAVLRRVQAERGPPIAGARGDRLMFAGWTLDVRQRELIAPDGRSVDLSSGEYDLLLVFCENPQRVIARDRLLDLGRGRVADAQDRSADVMVSRLRRKLEPDVDSPSLIKTVRGAGYYFVPAVTRV